MFAVIESVRYELIEYGVPCCQTSIAIRFAQYSESLNLFSAMVPLLVRVGSRDQTSADSVERKSKKGVCSARTAATNWEYEVSR